jgi:1-acyl-sn-glycerol-3-phosphate acyltransferase
VALALGARTQRWWARGLLRGLGLELALSGVPPERPCLVVANHLSYCDIAVLGTLFPGRFVAKSEIAAWPILGQLARLAGTIFVVQARKKDVLRVDREIARTLAAGFSVVLFAEGGSSRGATVERLKSALFASAARQGFPCLPVSLRYETPRDPWAPAASVCWWGGMRFWPHVWNLLGLHGIRAEVSIAPEPVVGAERKELAGRLHHELLARFRPVRQAPLAPDFPWPEIFADERPPG